MAAEVSVEENPEKEPIEKWTMVALVLCFVSFVLPVVPAIAGIIVAQIAKRRLRRSGGDRLNEGLNTIGQITALFTLFLFFSFVWWFEWR